MGFSEKQNMALWLSHSILMLRGKGAAGGVSEAL